MFISRANLASLLSNQSYFKPIRCLSSSTNLKTTGLYEFHKGRKARLEPFAGFLMPIVYQGQTITSEHIRTREAASVFDVSHMLQTVVEGPDRDRFVESIAVADLDSLPLNKGTLSLFTNDSGGIIDDCIISKRPDHLHIVSNASNAETIWTLMKSKLDTSMDIKLKRLERKCLLALQGPRSSEVLQTLTDVDLSTIGFMEVFDTELKGIGTCQVSRCGYTGEDGFEISIEDDLALSLMNSLCRMSFVGPAGLGARNTLRLEAGLCLHGNDMNENTSPIECGLNWVIGKRRRQEGGFPGFEVIKEQLKVNTKLKRSGLIAVGDGPVVRDNYEVIDIDGKSKLGLVTSGSFSPTLQKNIAMAFLPTSMSKEFGRTVLCKVRGKHFVYEIKKLPFVPSRYYIKRN